MSSKKKYEYRENKNYNRDTEGLSSVVLRMSLVGGSTPTKCKMMQKWKTKKTCSMSLTTTPDNGLIAAVSRLTPTQPIPL